MTCHVMLCPVEEPQEGHEASSSKTDPLYMWRALAERADQDMPTVRIAFVGKYTHLEDAYMSVIKSLEHAAMAGLYLFCVFPHSFGLCSRRCAIVQSSESSRFCGLKRRIWRAVCFALVYPRLPVACVSLSFTHSLVHFHTTKSCLQFLSGRRH